MNYIKDIELKKTDFTYNVIVEIPKGTNSKYELVDGSFDKVIEVRKVIGKYPFYYGCFPQTYAGDKDPLDMILLTNKKYKILDIVEVIPIGVIRTIDDGEVDDKIFVIPANERIKNLKKHIAKAIKFLKTYKGKNSKMLLDDIFYTEGMDKEILESYGAFKLRNRNTKTTLKVDF